jgi:hypothetical protein
MSAANDALDHDEIGSLTGRAGRSLLIADGHRTRSNRLPQKSSGGLEQAMARQRATCGRSCRRTAWVACARSLRYGTSCWSGTQGTVGSVAGCRSRGGQASTDLCEQQCRKFAHVLGLYTFTWLHRLARMTDWTPELLLARQVRWRRARMMLTVLLAVGIGVVFVFRYL